MMPANDDPPFRSVCEIHVSKCVFELVNKIHIYKYIFISSHAHECAYAVKKLDVIKQIFRT